MSAIGGKGDIDPIAKESFYGLGFIRIVLKSQVSSASWPPARWPGWPPREGDAADVEAVGRSEVGLDALHMDQLCHRRVPAGTFGLL